MKKEGVNERKVKEKSLLFVFFALKFGSFGKSR